MFARAFRITFAPQAEWTRIAASPPDSTRLLSGFILPLCCVPAISWSGGLALFGATGVVGSVAEDFGAIRILQGGLLVLAAASSPST